MKTFYFAIAFIVIAYAIIWTFNHLNPWFAILMAVVTIGLIIKQLTKKEDVQKK